MTPMSKIWWESGEIRAIYVYITINRVILLFLLLLAWQFGAFSRRGFPVAAISRLRVFRGSEWG